MSATGGEGTQKKIGGGEMSWSRVGKTADESLTYYIRESFLSAASSSFDSIT